ncbi:MAG: DUF1904 family protein [Bacteroidales bacterium]|nr:DUF1904 family protein [Bacteroidales bacterium]MBN2750726.1 DUF1904 family protein [Bacteroidales bacterium]
MPFLRFRAMDAQKVAKQSKPLVDELSEQLGTPAEYFTLEVIASTFVKDGAITEGFPIVDVTWFDRGAEKQQATASIITKHAAEMGYPEIDIVFMLIERSKYYENGVALG